MSENKTIQDQLEKDVKDAGLLLVALPEGDKLVGYQCTLVIQRADGRLDAVHAAVAADDVQREVGAAIRERTEASWKEGQ